MLLLLWLWCRCVYVCALVKPQFYILGSLCFSLPPDLFLYFSSVQLHFSSVLSTLQAQHPISKCRNLHLFVCVDGNRDKSLLHDIVVQFKNHYTMKLNTQYIYNTEQGQLHIYNTDKRTLKFYLNEKIINPIKLVFVVMFK